MAVKILRNNRMWLGVILTLLLLAVIRVPFRTEAVAPSHSGNLADLPADLLYSWLRMWGAYFASLVFAVFIGTLAATNEGRARLLLPVVDILQSIPILGFFPAAIYWFVKAGGAQFGVEAAVVFLIFTSQSWNLVFAVYDGIRSVPTESLEAARSMGLGSLAIFRVVYLPACFPRIVDNSTISWANGWYFLMACEIIALGPTSYKVPGIGSFLQYFIDQGRWSYVGLGILGLVLVIVVMDVFIWKPLRSLSALFRFESNKNESAPFTTGDRLLSLYRNSAAFVPLRKFIELLYRAWVRAEYALQPPSREGFHDTRPWKWGSASSLALFWTGLGALIALSLVILGRALLPPWSLPPSRIILSIVASAFRILGAYLVCLAWILPLVYWVHKRPFAMRVLVSGAQVMASVPATAFFPLIVLAVLRVFGITEIAVLLLLMTGMQWYLLFNVLGGAASLPNDLREVAASLGITRRLYIWRVFLPSIVPALVTGSITAVGGGWNALVISESMRTGAAPYHVFGIGSIINDATYEAGDERLLALALFFLVATIVLLNRFVWQPLYARAERKFKLEG